MSYKKQYKIKFSLDNKAILIDFCGDLKGSGTSYKHSTDILSPYKVVMVNLLANSRAILAFILSHVSGHLMNFISALVLTSWAGSMSLV